MNSMECVLLFNDYKRHIDPSQSRGIFYIMVFMKKMIKKIAGAPKRAYHLVHHHVRKRKVPDHDAIISPASGRVIEIRSVNSGDILFKKKGVNNRVMIPELSFPATIVMIEMTPFDVHVQRAPISGMIMRMDRYSGKHRNALGSRKYVLAEENEKVVALFENKTEKVAVIQVAGIAARRIRNVLEVGDEVSKGEIYGKIKFGSQVVVIVPHNRKVLVKVDDRMTDGETVIAE